MRLVRLLAQQRGAHFAALSAGEKRCGNSRVPGVEPIGENALRARQHRFDVPERVVEIETDRANGAGGHGGAC